MCGDAVHSPGFRELVYAEQHLFHQEYSGGWRKDDVRPLAVVCALFATFPQKLLYGSIGGRKLRGEGELAYPGSSGNDHWKWGRCRYCCETDTVVIACQHHATWIPDRCVTGVVFVVVHNSRTPVQHTRWTCALPLQAGSRSHHQPAVPSAQTRQTDHLWSESRTGRVGNRTNRDPDEASAWYEQNWFYHLSRRCGKVRDLAKGHKNARDQWKSEKGRVNMWSWKIAIFESQYLGQTVV